MKKAVFLILALALGLALFAEGPKDEALSALDEAKAQINKGDYVKAQEEIDFALSKINEILAEDLLVYIPEAPAGFTLDSKSSQPVNVMGTSLTAIGEYSKGDSQVDVTITVGGMLGQSGGLMGLASMFGGVQAAGKTVRVAGYTGNQEYDADEQSGTLTLTVGDKITVIVDGENIPNAELLKTFIDKMDLAKLEKSF
jgi:hypothetical protein